MQYNIKRKIKRLTKCKTLFLICVRQLVRQNVRHLNNKCIYLFMASKITVRISDGMKAELEHIVGEIGLWHNQSDFVKEALNEHIKKFWQGERLDNNY